MSYRPLEACVELMFADAIVDGLWDWEFDGFQENAGYPPAHLVPTLELAQQVLVQLQEEVRRYRLRFRYEGKPSEVFTPPPMFGPIASPQGQTKARTLADSEASRLPSVQDYGTDT